MIANRANLQLKLVRGRAKTIAARIGTWQESCPPASGGRITRTFLPTDITLWWFSFTMRTNFSYQQPTIALTRNPILNIGDPTQGVLMWTIIDTDTEDLITGNYVFDVAVTLEDRQPRFFAGGIASLFDNVTDDVVVPTSI